ncbi:stage IV sporulation protein FB [Paraliobacillus quinghaiensis]|uniref:Stage IV sporulation protein FB n=1 Tax=Paraliobacillus quinghaiensis TaxID=470815 RepID=A0A917WSC5_9BACI|nr:M50 family metallopeptidase [Paraliobacillus quinghaiensis]GGM27366.1 stage IV sporulation protein FB [Paraliobacillus quinghaiensis]
MKVRNYIPPISIHPTLWLSLILSILTGTFMEMFIIFSIVLIHELGHFLVATYYGWKIRKVMLWMFGGVMETDEHLSRTLKEETLVTIAGPFQHLVIFLLLLGIEQTSWLTPSLMNLALQYNATILLFNLLPVWPLDGGKLSFITLSKFLPFRKAHAIMITSSIFFIVIFALVLLGFSSFVLSTYLLFTFILWENRVEWKQRFYVFMRFLLKRHEVDQSKHKVLPIIVEKDARLIDIFSKFRRQYRHDIFVKNDWRVTHEANCLHAYFNLKQYRATINDVSREMQK